MKILENLSHHLLIAMPTLKDSFFTKSVVYLYEHTSNGAMGIVINKSLQINFENLLHHLEIDVADKDIANLPVFTGGPVGPEQGFVIHDRVSREQLEHGQKVTISASKEILQEISVGNGPEHFMVALGYAGWDQGQLEKEINHNDWLVAPLNKKILFSTAVADRWQKAVESIGVDISRLSDHVGHA